MFNAQCLEFPQNVVPQNVLKNEKENQYKTKKPSPFGEGPNQYKTKKAPIRKEA